MNVEDFVKGELSRRQFLGRSAANAAGVAAGMVGLAAQQAGASASAVRVGVIGVRSQGRELAAALAGMADVHVAALCDVDARVLATAQQEVSEQQALVPRIVSDFRRILDDSRIDAVVIATPDHWHADMAVAACEAGKDVYVEQPLAHSIAEGERIVDAARRTGRIVQTGLQQRSGAHFRSAVELVRSGGIGRVRLAKAWAVHRRKSIGRHGDAPVPAGVDYRRWLGPAAERPFNANRFHHNWRWFWDYGSGELGIWGVHMLDVARWGLGVGLPLRVAASGGHLYLDDDRQAPDTLSVQYTYPDAAIHWEHRLWSNRAPEGRTAAAAFYGDNGTLIVDRGGWKVYDRRDSLTADASEQQVAHLRNFIDCIHTRRTPDADAITGQASCTLCHLGNIAYRLGREVTPDPATGDLVG